MTIPVFVLAGQSNVGYLSNEIEDAFDDQYGVGNYELIRVFDAGAPLTRERNDKLDWHNPSELREDLTVDTVNALLEDDDRVFGGMIWIQGEADTYASNGAGRYGERLEDLIDGFREDVSSVFEEADIGLDCAPITILELSEQAPEAPNRIGWDTVIDGQREVAEDDPLIETLDPDAIANDANLPASDMFRDGLHYTDDFGVLLAEELVQTMVDPVPDMVAEDDSGAPTDGGAPDDGNAPDDGGIQGDGGTPDDGGVPDEPAIPIIPAVDVTLPDEEQPENSDELAFDDGGGGIDGLMFLLPLLPILGLLGAVG